MNEIKRVPENVIYWARQQQDVVLPTKNLEDACFDLYAYFHADYMVIQPHETKMIPTGLRCALSDKWVLRLCERGSTGTKGMGQRAGVVDSGYRGEIFVPITNLNTKPIAIVKKHVLEDTRLASILTDNFIVYPYEKAICQGEVIEVPVMDCKEITVEELVAIPSKRGEGALGSSLK